MLNEAKFFVWKNVFGNNIGFVVAQRTILVVDA